MLVFGLLFVILIVCRKVAKVSTINKKNILKNAFQYFFETNV